MTFISNEAYAIHAEAIRTQVDEMAGESLLDSRPMHFLGIVATCPRARTTEWTINATVALPVDPAAAAALLRGVFQVADQMTPGALREAIRRHMDDHPGFLGL